MGAFESVKSSNSLADNGVRGYNARNLDAYGQGVIIHHDEEHI